MQDQYRKSARQKDAHTCSSQELRFSRKYDLESQRKSVNGHYGFSSAFRLFIENLIISHRGHNLLTTVSQNLSKTYPIPIQNLSKSFSLYTLYTRIQLFSIFFHHFSQYQYRYQCAAYLVLCFYKKTCARLDQHREEQLLYNSSCHAFALTINHNISSLSYQVNRLLTVT